MSATYDVANDAMKSIVDSAWTNGAAAIIASATVSYIPVLYFQGIEPQIGPNSDQYWARWSRQSISAHQTTLRDGVNGKRYSDEGLIFVQVYAPMEIATASQKGEQLAMLIRESMRSLGSANNPHAIVFTNLRINELAPDNKSYRWNVVAEYKYDDIT